MNDGSSQEMGSAMNLSAIDPSDAFGDFGGEFTSSMNNDDDNLPF